MPESPGRQGLGGGFPGGGGRGGSGGGGAGWPDLDTDPEAALEAAELLEAAAEGCCLPLLRRLYDFFVAHAGSSEEAVEAAAAAVMAAAKEAAAGREAWCSRATAELGGLGRQAAALVDALRATTWRGRVLAAAAASATPDWRAKVEFLESVGLRPVERFGLAVVAERAAAYRPRPARSRAAGAGAGPRRVGLGGGGMGSEAVWVATQAGGREAAGSSMPTLQLKPVDSAARVGPITGHWLRRRRYPISGAAVFGQAVRANNVTAVPYLLNRNRRRLERLELPHGFSVRPALMAAAEAGQLAVLQGVLDWALNRAAASAAASAAVAAAATAAGLGGGAGAHTPAADPRVARDDDGSSSDTDTDDEALGSDGEFGEDEAGGAGAAVLRAVSDGAGAMLVGAARGGQLQAASWVLDTFGAGTGDGPPAEAGAEQGGGGGGRSLAWPWKGRGTAGARAGA
ncbi:hypothetical protein CHLRE_12g499205v5 [Chlamydomonas reinhardtii]|uniref:Uncharacterized protein n=1 Tax=Chlamydomonas reinhardtii TaxID=3055 RepID=A0A2K3D3E3_CHLRE|nr:uncharacterized protein CHLRE_12g499205v5 [Chlamydomonas reinhardtii]PNW75041.1 hypothetical protein CHLRE_12g499205v5 [Chlamydomonas reinhardtii]